MTTEEACEFLVRNAEINGAESFEKNFLKDDRILCSVFVFVGPHAEEMTGMIREQFNHFGFSLHRDEPQKERDDMDPTRNDSTESRNELTQKQDGQQRHQSIAGVLKHFRYAHLPEHLQAISKPCAELAVAMADLLPESPDLTCGLRDLLAAKDNFVRAKLG